MAMLATSPDLIAESWFSPTSMPQHQALPDDIWSKFDIDQDRALAIANPEAITDHSMGGFPSSMTFGHTPFSSSGTHMLPHGLATLPTPPHSPPIEPNLDDLVASIPEILESPSASPPSDINDILHDIEGMEATSLGDVAMYWSGCGALWPTPPAPPVPEESVKRDIMWGGGACCPGLFDVPIKKERQVSECSADVALREVLQPDEISEDEDDSEDNMPDTPSGTDSDCDMDEMMSETSSTAGSPRSTNSASRYSNFASNTTTTATTYFPSVSSEHNYCGRVPATDSHNMPGIITPSDTEDEVDVVSCNDQSEVMNLGGLTTSTPVSTTTSRMQQPSKRSVDVKRQLQLAIQEAMRNRQKTAVANGAASPEGEEPTTAGSRFVSVKIKTQGKPAAYTKRMRDYHSELIMSPQVMKTSKHRRRSRAESDEGRRSVHNSLERQRRVDLRNAFEYLRLLVPETKVLEKAPKVQILKKAAMHCKQLTHAEERLLREKEKLKKQQEYLQQRRSQCS